MMDQSDHFLRVIGQIGLLILGTLILGNLAGIFFALQVANGYSAQLFLAGLTCAMGAALAIWIMAHAALMNDMRAYHPLWWGMVVLSLLSDGLFTVAVMTLVSTVSGAA